MGQSTRTCAANQMRRGVVRIAKRSSPADVPFSRAKYLLMVGGERCLFLPFPLPIHLPLEEIMTANIGQRFPFVMIHIIVPEYRVPKAIETLFAAGETAPLICMQPG